VRLPAEGSIETQLKDALMEQAAHLLSKDNQQQVIASDVAMILHAIVKVLSLLACCTSTKKKKYKY
jgi:hypothetical protein